MLLRRLRRQQQFLRLQLRLQLRQQQQFLQLLLLSYIAGGGGAVRPLFTASGVRRLRRRGEPLLPFGPGASGPRPPRVIVL